MKRAFQVKREPLIIGAIITIVLTIVFVRVGLVFLYTDYVSMPLSILMNAIIFTFCWSFISFLLHKFPYYQVIGLSCLLLLAPIGDHFLRSFNPITIPVIILFWLGITYFIVPQFFKKYRIIIFSVYGLVVSYFLIFRMMPNYEENYHQYFIKFMLFPIPAFIALWGYEQWRWLKTLQADKGKAEIALLKSQINPHFFFNTLNNLYGLVIEKSDQAPEVILKLSDMMRYTIYEGKEDLVLLKDEVTYLENYIELHKLRYRKQVDISFSYDIDESAKVAPLMFIILLENAFKHGVEKLRENAFIHMNLTCQNNELHFSIENNFDKMNDQKSKGIGLENLKKRLIYLYPKQHELTIDKEKTIYKVQLNIQLT